MRYIFKRSIYVLLTMCFLAQCVKAQTNTTTITQSGWYRIAKNGPLIQGGSGGDRAAARFILKDKTPTLHQTTTFLSYVHFGKRPTITVLNNSYFSSGGIPSFVKIRIVQGGTYEGAALEVYVHKPGGRINDVSYYLQDNIQQSGWTAVDWQLITTTSGDNDGIPAGFSSSVISLKDLVRGYITDEGVQKSYFNGNLYTNGNVGIGTATPQSKLAVDGTVTAQKVKVTQNGWPDYVFDTAYRLRTIGNLENFIQSYKHLPDIPSTGEIAEKGNDLGKTDALLLKKIEELTLYLIRMNKRQSALDIQLKELKSINKQLMKRILFLKFNQK